MKFGTVNPSHAEIRDGKEQHVYDAMFTESHYELNFTEFGEELPKDRLSSFLVVLWLVLLFSVSIQ